MHDYTKADFDDKTRGMLDFAAKLTREPSQMRKADVERLRSLDLDDEEILATTLVTCMFNFMTRLADGLGVEYSQNAEAVMRKWMSAEALSQEWLTTSMDERV